MKVQVSFGDYKEVLENVISIVKCSDDDNLFCIVMERGFTRLFHMDYTINFLKK